MCLGGAAAGGQGVGAYGATGCLRSVVMGLSGPLNEGITSSAADKCNLPDVSGMSVFVKQVSFRCLKRTCAAILVCKQAAFNTAKCGRRQSPQPSKIVRSALPLELIVLRQLIHRGLPKAWPR